MEQQTALQPNEEEKLSRYFERIFSSIEREPREELSETDLPDDAIHVLCEQILSLSDKGKELFYGRYCFMLSDDAMQTMFGTAFPAGRLRYYKEMFSAAHNLPRDETISERSFQKASELALDRDMKRTKKEANAQRTTEAGHEWKRITYRFLKGVVAAIIILAIGFTTAMTVNAEFRKRVVNWFVHRFNTHSTFYNMVDIETSIEELVRYQPEYIPERYEIAERTETSEGLIYRYTEQNSSTLYVIINMPDKDIALDTEGMEILTTTFEGEEAYYYSSANKSVFVFSKDGYAMYISGNITLEECEQIAKKIKKQ